MKKKLRFVQVSIHNFTAECGASARIHREIVAIDEHGRIWLRDRQGWTMLESPDDDIAHDGSGGPAFVKD